MYHGILEINCLISYVTALFTRHFDLHGLLLSYFCKIMRPRNLIFGKKKANLRAGAAKIPQ